MISGGPLRPSFFEIYAAEHLSSALRPAVRFALEVLSVRHPRLVRIAAWSDEIFSGLLILLETSQLQKESSTLAESFYSLRRSSSPSFSLTEKSSAPLSVKEIILSVLFTVVAPHVKLKLDNWYRNATGGAARDLLSSSLHSQGVTESEIRSEIQSIFRSSPPQTNHNGISSLSIRSCLQKLERTLTRLKLLAGSPVTRQLILKWYPLMSAACDGTNLLFSILYLYGHSRHFTPALALQGLILRRMSPSELLANATRSSFERLKRNQSSSAAEVVSNISGKIMNILKISFFAGILAFRFLEYYYAAEASIPRETGPTITAPVALQPATGVDRKSATAKGSCPLCHQARVNPTACSTSGYVFCYLCILRHVEQDAQCPVTQAPTTVEDLIRIFDDATSL